MPLLKLVAARACITLDGQTSETVSGATLLDQHKVDAWFPDSRSFALAAGAETANTARSVASSPIVMAAAPATATSLRKQGANSWAGLLATHGTLGGFPVWIQPDQSSVAVTISNELTAMATQSAKDPYLGLGGAAAAITAVKQLTPQQLSAPIPAGQVRIAERRMIDGDIGTIVPAKEGEPALDYPWVMPNQPAKPQAATAASRLVAALFGTAGRQARKQLGFDEPGATHVDLGAGSPSVVLPPVDLASAPAQFMMSSTANLKAGRALALLDISGSMGDPAASGQTPMESLRASVPIMVSSLVPSTEVGVWEFGYRLDGDKDYRELLPTAALSTNRKPLLQTVATIKAQRSGTALYSSVRDAYRYTLDHYDANKTNMLLVFTDGKNQDAPGGVDLPTLTAQLAAMQNKAKPISVVFFGFGDADIAAMQQIVKSVQHGIVVKIDKPQQILGAFIDAMAKTTVFAG
ncbi:MAG: VWA domain-containing protein [Nakamurella sp.]